jgi:hypothetical protein
MKNKKGNGGGHEGEWGNVGRKKQRVGKPFGKKRKERQIGKERKEAEERLTNSERATGRGANSSSC